jgi:tryptophanyl-tRNA synthetase
VLKSYTTPRKLEWKGNPNPVKKPEKSKESGKKVAKTEEKKETPKTDANGAI